MLADDGWRAVQLLNQMPAGGWVADLHEIDAAYLPSLLCRVGPFERFIVGELYGLEGRVFRTPDEVAEDCGMTVGEITVIAERAVGRMKAMQTLGPD